VKTPGVTCAALDLLAALDGEPGIFAGLAGAPAASTAPAGIPSGREQTIAACRPFAILEVLLGEWGRLYLREGPVDTRVEIMGEEDPLRCLAHVLSRFSPQGPAPPQPAGVAIALSYDAAPWFVLGKAPKSPLAPVPILHASFYEAVLVHDPASGQARSESTGFINPAWPRPTSKVEQRKEELAARLGEFRRPAGPLAGNPAAGAIESSLTHADYIRIIGRAKALIAAGDIYQVNLSQQLRVGIAQDVRPAALWERLIRAHPTGWSAYYDLGEHGTLLSNSPECFLRRRGGTVQTFPIKGTRARGGASGAALPLTQDPKELAEHRMIVDLERNDLGKVARIGTVEVPAREYVETYGTVEHLVSCVSAQVPADTTILRLLAALFPGGSITGAPKKRACEIIEALEPVPRCFYTGVLGTLAGDGSADFSILIRTAHYKDHRLAYSAGGGITAGSDPEAEVAESWLKARAFLESLGVRVE